MAKGPFDSNEMIEMQKRELLISLSLPYKTRSLPLSIRLPDVYSV